MMMSNNSTLPEDRRIDLTKSVVTWDASLKRRRAVWEFLVRPLFKALPRFAGRQRISLLRLMGARIGERCLVEAGVDVLMPWNLELESFVVLGRNTEIYNYAPVRIGSMTVISQYVYLCTGTHDYTHPHFPLTWAPITVGSECWVAAGVFVAPGVSIGDGAVIGARSVVIKDMPSWMVCAGHPCRPLKPRVLREL